MIALIEHAIERALERALGRANNDFAFRLLQALPPGAQNCFLSPYSLHCALSLTLNGARGATLQAMKTGLGWGRTGRPTINRAYAALRAELEQNAADITLGIANSIWAGPGLELQAGFEQRGREIYAARVEQVDFADPATRQRINAWIAQNTCEQIPELLQPEHLTPPPSLALANAIYFKGLWRAPFDPAKTQEAPFSLADGAQKTIPFMHSARTYSYLEGPDFQLVSLPYGAPPGADSDAPESEAEDSAFSLEVCLPAPGRPLSEFIAHLNGRAWQTWLEQMAPTAIELALPRFSLRYTAGLTGPLSQIGLGLAFSPQADFGDLCRAPVAISNLIHGAALEVTEEGSQAAAASVVTMLRVSLARPKPRLVVDRPFFCAIRHRPSAALLFAGLVYEP